MGCWDEQSEEREEEEKGEILDMPLSTLNRYLLRPSVRQPRPLPAKAITRHLAQDLGS